MCHNKLIHSGLLLFLFVFLASVSSAQEPPAPSANDQVTTPVTLEDLIDFNLKDADINNVVQFITKYTGKPVVKDNSVGAKLTVSSPNKIRAYEALDLIYDSLRMQGFVVIETEDVIQIVPVADTAKYDILTLSGPLPEHIARQKGRLIRKILPLNNVRATPMKANLDPILGKHASIVADERTNKLLITDTVRNIERYESILRELDALGFDNMEVRIVPLKHADATKMAAVLEQTVVKAASAGGPPTPGQEARGVQVVIIPDTRTNSLVIASPVEKINSIVSFIDRLDVPKAKDVSVHVLPVRYAEAEALARAVTDVLRHKAGKSEQDIIEVRAMGRDNTLLVLASDENMELIREIVRSLDTEESQKRESRRYQLKYLDAEDTATELGKLYGDMQENNNRNPYYFFYGSGNRRDQNEVKFVPIARSNSIMVLAPPTEFKLIESLIAEIDQPVDPDEILPKIYRIKFAKASDVEEILNAVFGKKTQTTGFWDYWRSEDDKSSDVGRLTGKIKFSSDDNTNSIIAITNNKMNYEVVDRMIAKLDTTTPELANTMIVNLQHANAAILSTELNSLFGKPVKPQGQGEGEDTNRNNEYFSFWWGADSGRREDARPISNLIEQVRFVPDARTNSILVTTAAQNFEVIRTLVEGLDKEEPQVLIKVRIVEVQRDKDKRIGLRWTPAPGTYSPEDLENSISALGSLDVMDSIGSGNGPIGAASNTSVGRDFSQTLDSGTGVISSSINLNLLLQLLVKNLDAQIMIAPTLYVSNNEKGHLFVGENIPRLKGTQITPEGTRNDTFENEDIGITMEIVPNISRMGSVVLNVNLTTAQRTGVTRFGSDVLQKREYNTKLAVNNGDTMVLGGIRMSTDQKTVRKIPILGSIPLLGYLFRNNVSVNQVTDLYAFITPHIISTTAQAIQATEDIQQTIGDPTKPHEKVETSPKEPGL